MTTTLHSPRSSPSTARRVRGRLLLPALTVAVCLFSLAIVRAVQLRGAQEALLNANALSAAQNSARSLDATIAGTQALLVSIAELVDLSAPRARTDTTLRRIRAAAPIPYLHLVLFSADGEIIGSGRPGTGRLPPSAIAASPMFQRVLQSKQFVVGPIEWAAVRPGLPRMLPFALPILDGTSGAVRAVITATVMVDSLDAVKAVRAMPAGSVLTIMDTTGMVVYRTLDEDHWIGRSFRGDTGIATDLRLGERVGSGLRSADGTMRLIGARTMERAPWIIYLGLPVQVTLDLARNHFTRDLFGAALITLIVLAIGYRSTISVVEPIESLTRDARAIAAGDMARRSTVNSSDEVGDLARAFNQMADTIVARNDALRTSHERLLHAQKMDALGQLAGGIAHDFNNYLHVIMAHAELAQSTLPVTAAERDDVQEIIAAAARAAALTRQILVFSRKQVVEPETLDLNEVVTGIQRMLTRLLGEQRSLILDLSHDPIPVLMDRGEAEQVIVNLLTNARDAIAESGTVTIRSSLQHPAGELTEPRQAVFEVIDSGSGMTPELCERIFDPFFTTKDRAHGTGLGLAIAYGIIDQAGGSIAVTSVPAVGTTFTIRLPLAIGEPVERALPVPAIHPGHGEGTILLVDDDAAVRLSTEAMLKRLGYDVIIASHGQAALDFLAQNPTRFDLLLTDLIMPGMSGTALAARARELNPALPVLCMSGYADDDAFRRALDESEVSCIMKPFSGTALADALQRLLAARRIMSENTSAAGSR